MEANDKINSIETIIGIDNDSIDGRCFPTIDDDGAFLFMVYWCFVDNIIVKVNVGWLLVQIMKFLEVSQEQMVLVSCTSRWENIALLGSWEANNSTLVPVEDKRCRPEIP